MATEVATAEGAAARVRTDDRPYAPSWVDVILRAIEKVPGPTWLTYVVVLVISCGMAASEGWLSSASTFPNLDFVQASYGLFFVMPLAVLHYLDRAAGDAWDRFRPATNLDDRAAARVRYELTVIPARSGWVLLALGYAANTLWFLSDPVGTGIAGQPTGYVAMRFVIEGFITGALFMLVLQTVRQLRIVDRQHGAAVNVDPLQPRPVHALSRLTARSALGIVFVAVVISVPYPGIPESTWLAGILVFSVPLLALAVAAFFLPLRGLHDRLLEEKSRMQSAIATRLSATSDALHGLVDSETANSDDADRSREAQTRIDALSKAQTALIQERDLVARLSTWPWDPSTLRAVVSAIALPIALFLITRVLDRFV